MQTVSPSTSVTAPKRGLINKIKAAWAKGEQPVHGNLFNGYFFPVHQANPSKHL